MIREKFKNKTIAFFGASLTEEGGFCANIRSYFRENDVKTVVFNRGVGGTRAYMALYMMEEEIFYLKPDIVFIQYAANDIGIWLYDGNKPVTEGVLEARRKRDEECFNSLKKICEILISKGIEPILVSPIATNELLIEKENIKTIADNKEKEDLLGPSFYTRKTFRNINNALREYEKRYNQIAKELGIEVVNMFSYTYKAIYEKEGLVGEDAIHYTEKGQKVLTNCLLNFIGEENYIEDFKSYPDLEEAREVEKILRILEGFKRATLMPENVNPKITDEEVMAKIKVNKDNKSLWNYQRLQIADMYYGKIQEIKQKEMQAIRELAK